MGDGPITDEQILQLRAALEAAKMQGTLPGGFSFDPTSVLAAAAALVVCAGCQTGPRLKGNPADYINPTVAVMKFDNKAGGFKVGAKTYYSQILENPYGDGWKTLDLKGTWRSGGAPPGVSGR